ncbi:protein mono-ADP-ribosyltransferase PARP14-like isoform X2 [Haliotis cracherodii]|uniref:protein mono-ADP-ribosyltransferase PARP14-like isoform X2 n=1 Tax=Haliotis cracherodii TaxID=6455 RepID=UPI0039ED5E84
MAQHNWPQPHLGPSGAQPAVQAQPDGQYPHHSQPVGRNYCQAPSAEQYPYTVQPVGPYHQVPQAYYSCQLPNQHHAPCGYQGYETFSPRDNPCSGVYSVAQHHYPQHMGYPAPTCPPPPGFHSQASHVHTNLHQMHTGAYPQQRNDWQVSSVGTAPPPGFQEYQVSGQVNQYSESRHHQNVYTQVTHQQSGSAPGDLINQPHISGTQDLEKSGNPPNTQGIIGPDSLKCQEPFKEPTKHVHTDPEPQSEKNVSADVTDITESMSLMAISSKASGMGGSGTSSEVALNQAEASQDAPLQQKSDQEDFKQTDYHHQQVQKTQGHNVLSEEKKFAGSASDGQHTSPIDQEDSQQGVTLKVSNLNPETPKEDLINFLEALCNVDVEQIKYTEEKDIAVVTFQGSVDFQQVKGQHSKKKRRVNGHLVELAPLGSTHKLSVKGHSKELTPASLQKYFESPDSGNDLEVPIEDVYERQDEDYFVVTFKDSEAVQRIVSKGSHQLEGANILVHEFYESVGRPVRLCEDDEKETSAIIDRLKLAEIRVLEKDFIPTWEKKGLKITTDGKTSIVFEGQAQIVIEAKSKLECLRKDMSKYRHSLKFSRSKICLLRKLETELYIMGKLQASQFCGGWQLDKDYRVTIMALSGVDLSAMTHLLEKCLVEKEIDLFGIDYKSFEDSFRAQKTGTCFELSPKSSKVLIIATDKDIVSLKKDADSVVAALRKENQLMGKAVVIKKSVTICPLVMRFVLKQSQKFNEHDVKVYPTSENQLCIEGSENFCSSVSKHVKHIQDRVMTKTWEVENDHVKELEKAQLISSLVMYVEKATQCVVGFDVKTGIHEVKQERWAIGKGRTLHVVQADWRHLDVDALVIAVDSQYQPLDEVSRQVLKEAGGHTRPEIAENQFKRSAILSNGDTVSTSYGSPGCVKALLLLCISIQGHDDVADRMSFSKAIQNCLVTCDLKQFCSLAIPAFKLSLGLNDHNMAQDILKSLQSYFSDGTSQSIKNVVLLSEDKYAYTACLETAKIFLPETKKTISSRRNRVFANETQQMAERDAISVSVIKGELVKQEVDVIVNTVSPSLILHEGAISKSIFAAGGNELQTLCYKARPRDFLGGQFVATKAVGKLTCKEVFHCCLPSKHLYNSGAVFLQLMKDMLDAAARKQFQSIALPALGTGNLGYDASKVAGWLYEAIRTHRKVNPSSSLKKVLMVIFHKDSKSYDAFQTQQKMFEEKPDTAGYKKEPTYADVVAPKTNKGRRDRRKIEIILTEGQIAKQQTDVIVNTADNWLDLSKGAVSQSILKEAGSSIQEECNKKYKSKTPIPEGTFVVTKAGKLKSHYIYHVCLPRFSYPGSEAKGKLSNVILQCLNTASDHNSKKIAFPALGTGSLGYPPEMTAKVMYEMVKTFEDTVHQTSIEKVVFVVYPKDHHTVRSFKSSDQWYKMHHGRGATHGGGGAPHGGGGTTYGGGGATHGGGGAMGGQASTGNPVDYKYHNMHVTIKSGDILNETCDCIAITADPTLNLWKGTITKNLLQKDRGNLLEKNCKEPSQRKEYDSTGKLMISSFQCCSANMLLLLNREMVKKDQQQAILRSLECASLRDNISLAFPIFANGHRNAVEMAKDLQKALKAYDNSGSGLFDITVVVYENDMLAAFKKKFAELMSEETKQVFGASFQPAEEPSRYEDTPFSNPRDRNMVGTLLSVLIPESAMSKMTKVEYSVASDQESCIEEAIGILKKLSQHSPTVQEDIKDEKLKCIDSGKKERLEALSQKFEINVKVDSHAGILTLKGKSFQVCKALKEVLQIISSFPKVLNLEDDQERMRSLSSPATFRQNSQEVTPTSLLPSEGHKDSRSRPSAADNILLSTQDVKPKINLWFPPAKQETPVNSFGNEDDEHFEHFEDEELYGDGNMDSVHRTKAASASASALFDDDKEVEWFVVDDTDEGRRLQSYDSMNSKIEAAYLKGDYSVVLQGQEEEQYVIDFDKMEEYLKGEEKDRVPVIRRQKVTDASATVPQKLRGIDPEGMKLVQLVRSSSEFLNVTEQFTNASKLPSSSVVKIEEILNVTLFKNYESKKAQMLAQDMKEDELNEKQLWHGPLVNTDVIVSVSNFGFNRNYCNYSEEDLGQGVYFYTNIGPILKTSQPDRSGHHHVCLSKVLTGRACPGRSTFRAAPASFHSVVDIDSAPSKFAIFFDNQALPLYLLTFTAEQK